MHDEPLYELWRTLLSGSEAERSRLATNLAALPPKQAFDQDLRMQGVLRRDLRRIQATRELLRRATFEVPDPSAVVSPSLAAAHFAATLWGKATESFAVIVLDARNKLLTLEQVATGAVDYCHVDPREVFRPAIVARGSAVILGHNHPSGNTEASDEDLELTRELRCLGQALGVDVLDHIILGGKDRPRWSSLAAEGIMDSLARESA